MRFVFALCSSGLIALSLPHPPSGSIPAAPQQPLQPVEAAVAAAAVPADASAAASGPAASGHAWADFDGDGLEDVYLVNPAGPGRLMRNAGDGRFEDVSALAALNGCGRSLQAAWIDFDRDQRLDLYLLSLDGHSRLLRGAAGGPFEDVTAAASLLDHAQAVHADWIDYDRDQRIDLRLSLSSGDLILYHNLGQASFEPIALDLEKQRAQPPLALSAIQPAEGEAAPTSDSRGGPGRESADGAVADTRRPLAPELAGAAAPMPGLGAAATLATLGQHAAISAICAASIKDQAGGMCILASRLPTLDRLLPLGPEFFVSPSGNVGIGTMTPQFPLDVAGQGRFDRSVEVVASIQGPPSVLLTNPTGGAIYSMEAGVITGSFGIRDQIANAHRLVINSSGLVGIGILSPTEALHVAGRALFDDGGTGRFTIQPDQGGTQVGVLNGEPFHLINNGNRMTILNNGQVGIGDTTPAEKLTIKAAGTPNGVQALLGVQDSDDSYVMFLGQDSSGASNLDLYNSGGVSTINLRGAGNNYINSGNVGIGTTSPAARLHVAGDVLTSGRVTAGCLTLTGGCDLAEPFDVHEESVEPGMVVSIDPEHPGALKLASEDYDPKVAGVVSGAGDLKPGVSLSQEGVMEGGQLVALTGRVYCWCDASFGAIGPGDRLTTSTTPGHAMKSTNPEKADGAVIGKAMSALTEGRGLVLVLVNLQ